MIFLTSCPSPSFGWKTHTPCESAGNVPINQTKNSHAWVNDRTSEIFLGPEKRGFAQGIWNRRSPKNIQVMSLRKGFPHSYSFRMGIGTINPLRSGRGLDSIRDDELHKENGQENWSQSPQVLLFVWSYGSKRNWKVGILKMINVVS